MCRRLIALLFTLSLAGCEEPLVILGDLPGFMRITAGIPDSAGTRVDSLAVRTRLTFPAGLAVDSGGILFITDLRSRVFRVTPAGRIQRLLNHDPCFEKTCVGRPQGLAVGAGGLLYIAEDMSDRIWRLNPANGELVPIAGTGEHGVTADGANARQAALASPTSVVVLADGRVAFAERNANRIRVIGTDGVLRTLAGTGTQGEAEDGSTAISSPLSLPTGLALGGNVLYVSETGSHTVRAIDLGTGVIRKIAGIGSAGFSGDNGPAIAARLDFPAALAASPTHLYISDQNNDRIRVVQLQSGTIQTFAGTGTRNFTGNARAAGETALATPRGLAYSRFGFLYIADSGHHIVWRTPVDVRVQQ